MGGHKRYDVGSPQAFETERQIVDAQSAPNERSHHVEIGARGRGRQCPLDGQVAPEATEHLLDLISGFILDLFCNHLKTLQVIKNRAHRLRRGVSGMTRRPAIFQKSVQIA